MPSALDRDDGPYQSPVDAGDLPTISEGAVSATVESTIAPTDILQRSRILEGPLRSAVLWLALPVLGEQALNLLVTWNDAILAGMISPEATGAIGVAGYLSWFMTMLFWMVDTGAGAIVSRAIGAKKYDEASRITNQALCLSLFMGLFGTAFVWSTAPIFASLLNMRGQAAQIAVEFMRIDSIGFLGTAISFAMAACLRGAGDTRTPMKMFGVMNLVNCACTWVLTFGIASWPGMGTAGIAWGTVIARFAGALLFLVYLQRRGGSRDEKTRPIREHVRLQGSLMRPNRELIGRILRIGIPAAADGAIAFSGHFVFMTIVTRVPTEFPGSVLYAAHIVGIRIESLSYLPANAWSVAAATMVGQNLGASQPGRARHAAHEAARQAVIMLTVTGVCFFFAAGQFFHILSKDPAVAQCGVPALRGLALVQPALAVLIVYLGSLRGAGDTRTPMLITALGMIGLRIPLALFGGFVLEWGLLGAWLGMFADLVVRSILLFLRFRGGRWQRVNV
jgi:putative MATE family efflux protein